MQKNRKMTQTHDKTKTFQTGRNTHIYFFRTQNNTILIFHYDHKQLITKVHNLISEPWAVCNERGCTEGRPGVIQNSEQPPGHHHHRIIVVVVSKNMPRPARYHKRAWCAIGCYVSACRFVWCLYGLGCFDRWFVWIVLSL